MAANLHPTGSCTTYGASSLRSLRLCESQNSRNDSRSFTPDPKVERLRNTTRSWTPGSFTSPRTHHRVATRRPKTPSSDTNLPFPRLAERTSAPSPRTYIPRVFFLYEMYKIPRARTDGCWFQLCKQWKDSLWWRLLLPFPQLFLQ